PAASATYPLSLYDALPIFSSAEELPFRMACLAQQGLQSVDVSDPVDGTLTLTQGAISANGLPASLLSELLVIARGSAGNPPVVRSEEHTSELQSRENLVCR